MSFILLSEPLSPLLPCPRVCPRLRSAHSCIAVYPRRPRTPIPSVAQPTRITVAGKHDVRAKISRGAPALPSSKNQSSAQTTRSASPTKSAARFKALGAAWRVARVAKRVSGFGSQAGVRASRAIREPIAFASLSPGLTIYWRTKLPEKEHSDALVRYQLCSSRLAGADEETRPLLRLHEQQRSTLRPSHKSECVCAVTV